AAQLQLVAGGAQGAAAEADVLVATLLQPGLDQRCGGGGKPGVPDPQVLRRADTAGEAGEQRVALRDRLPEALAQLPPGRPAGGEEAVEVGPALGRRALDQGQAVGREDRDRRSGAGDRGWIGGVPVEEVAATFAAADRGQEPVLDAVVVADRRLRSRQGAAEGDQVATVRSAKGATGEGEVEGLDQIRLAGAVGTDDADDPRLQLDPDAVEAAQGAGLDRGDEHGGLTRPAGPRSDVEPDRHHQVAEVVSLYRFQKSR